MLEVPQWATSIRVPAPRVKLEVFASTGCFLLRPGQSKRAMSSPTAMPRE